MDQKDREEIALFRMSLIGDLVIPGLTTKERAALLRDKASRTYRIPGTLRTRIAESTFRDWIRLYKLGGLEALKPPYRCDSGRCRSLPPKLADRILQLREEDPSRSVHTLLRTLQLAGELDSDKLPPASSVYRLLEAHGVSKRRPSAKHKDRRPFAFEHRNQCWQSDVMYGPLVPGPGGKPRKTYLISLLDDATRLIVHCQFGMSSSWSVTKGASIPTGPSGCKVASLRRPPNSLDRWSTSVATQPSTRLRRPFSMSTDAATASCEASTWSLTLASGAAPNRRTSRRCRHPNPLPVSTTSNSPARHRRPKIGG